MDNTDWRKKEILIFGQGRLGSSITAYCRDLGHQVSFVTRTEFNDGDFTIFEKIASAEIIAAAIPDDLIGPWFQTLAEALKDKTVIHFSGANNFENMLGYHPLFSFPKHVVPSAEISRITIAREEGAPPFSQIIPGASNPEFEISIKDKALYHALAVLSGNLSAHIWNKCAKAFGQKWGEDPAVAYGAYLHSVVERFKESPLNSVTGPIARQDQGSVNRNLDSLAEHPELLAFYKLFLEQAWPEFQRDLRD